MNFALSEEQELFRKTVRDWVERECPKSVALHLEQREFEFPFELWDKMSEAGFHGVGIAEEYGGQGGDIVTQALLARELGRSLAGLTWMWGLSSFAGAKAIGFYGSDEQRERFLPRLARGETRFAIAVTEPSGGTDLLGALGTSARPTEGGWRINGQKIWSSAANVSDYLLLLARSDRAVEKRTQGTTLFLVPRESEGLETRPIPKIGMRALASCEIFLDDVFVPDDLVLGEPGRGWYHLLNTLNNERILVAALCTGIIDGVLEDALAYMAEREAFGRSIGHFQALQHYIANIAMWQEQAELVTYHAAWLQQQGQACARQANMAKVLASEYAGQAADLGLQILGGMGYSAETNMQRYWRDARLYRIGPITNEMARNVIAESYGLPRSF